MLLELIYADDMLYAVFPLPLLCSTLRPKLETFE